MSSRQTSLRVFLAFLVFLGACTTPGQTEMQQCEIDALNACMEPFQEGYSQGAAREDVCEGYQMSVLCATDKCQGETLNLFRYVMGEHDLMNMKLSECPVRDDYTERKQSVKDLDDLKEYGDYIGDMQSSDCAIRAHNNCMAKLANPDEPNICKKLHDFIRCYIAATYVCDSPIIRDFANLCETHGSNLLRSLENTPGIVSCAPRGE